MEGYGFNQAFHEVAGEISSAGIQYVASAHGLRFDDDRIAATSSRKSVCAEIAARAKRAQLAI